MVVIQARGCKDLSDISRSIYRERSLPPKSVEKGVLFSTWGGLDVDSKMREAVTENSMILAAANIGG